MFLKLILLALTLSFACSGHKENISKYIEIAHLMRNEKNSVQSFLEIQRLCKIYEANSNEQKYKEVFRFLNRLTWDFDYRNYSTYPDSQLALEINKFIFCMKNTDRLQENVIISQLEERETSRLQRTYEYYSFIFKWCFDHTSMMEYGSDNINSSDLNLDQQQAAVYTIQLLLSYYSRVKYYLYQIKPPDFSAAQKLFDNFPGFENSEYFYFQIDNFDDFTIEIEGKRKNYKTVYVDQYIQLVLDHCITLKENYKYKDLERIIDVSVISKTDNFKYYIDPQGLPELVKLLKHEAENGKR